MTMHDAESLVGQRVVVTGLAGSGKSTFSRALGSKTGLQLIHLDLLFWKPGWIAPSETEWRETQRVALAGDSWIADGNYGETLELRLERADTVVVLDTPWPLCVGRALRRGVQNSGGQMPEGCDDSAWRRLRGEWPVAGRIIKKRRSEPERERSVIAQHGQHAAVHRIPSSAAARDFLDRIDMTRRREER